MSAGTRTAHATPGRKHSAWSAPDLDSANGTHSEHDVPRQWLPETDICESGADSLQPHASDNHRAVNGSAPHLPGHLRIEVQASGRSVAWCCPDASLRTTSRAI